MSALVKLYHGAGKAPRYVSLDLHEDFSTRPTRNYLGVEVSAGTLNFKAKEKVVLHLGDVTPKGYNGVVAVNPFLLQAVTNVSCPSILEPDEASPITLSFTVPEALEFDGPLLRIYLLD